MRLQAMVAGGLLAPLVLCVAGCDDFRSNTTTTQAANTASAPAAASNTLLASAAPQMIAPPVQVQSNPSSPTALVPGRSE